LLANSPEGVTSLPEYVATVTDRLAKARWYGATLNLQQTAPAGGTIKKILRGNLMLVLRSGCIYRDVSKANHKNGNAFSRLKVRSLK